jgi:hypothetical protein
MSGTRRTPINRPPVAQITPRAIDLYVAMSRLRCTCAPPSPTRTECPGCERWWDLHSELDDELNCEPWQWPCVARQSPTRAGSTCMNEGIAARMAALKAAAKARRTKPSSREEGNQNAEPVDAGDTFT